MLSERHVCLGVSPLTQTPILLTYSLALPPLPQPNHKPQPHPEARAIATADFLGRAFARCSAAAGSDQRTDGGGYNSNKGGELRIDIPSQHVLERTNVQMNSAGDLECRFTVALPARGRSILGSWANEILTVALPNLIHSSMYAGSIDLAALRGQVTSVEDQQALRALLRPNGLVAFVRDGAILPRASGASDTPLISSGVVPFTSPASMRVSFTLPNSGTITGMGVRQGVTLIVGGGFHGKSTLLQAMQVGCYDHVPGDGREFVVVDETAVKVRAEDGRSVASVNISPFISNLPFGKATNSFSTADASGSTSQAASIIEAIEAGSHLLLVDEDTCATNFMIRDARMQALVAADKEPITPFISRVRNLFEQEGISSILVIGGSGDYFDVCDFVVMMDSYTPQDRTQEAKQIAAAFAATANPVAGLPPPPPASGGGAATASPFTECRTSRVPIFRSVSANGGKVTARGLGKVQVCDPTPTATLTNSD